ncbi:c-type cytochrome biogenesis protein CcmI [Candidatus Parabeggiatoa sp. HSG14]|uniref:c-type cytochrome biogenesis protein CcmI n=1 Tax=Candidatus Parabeggiatoa sp. HSG14 TaxID=3055593 RepID=UPI0025A9301F|nr:c-type cytochrome biogenesis protein CcmI [Thiotrichales bacterium HSG14]
MLTFWIIIVVLTVFALIFVIPPFFKKSPLMSDVDRNRLNVAIYKERLAELEQEDIAPEQLALAKQELEKTLAQDLDDGATFANQPRARWASAIVAIGIPALAIGGYWKLGAPHLIVEKPATESHAQKEIGKVPSDFDKMVNKLADRLQQQPNDETGWRMLARSYKFLKRYEEAARAYSKLLTLVEEPEPQLLADFAEALAMSNDGRFAGQPTILLKTALDLDANHHQTLWLLGFAAAEKNDSQAAITYWRRLLVQIPSKEKEMRQMLETHIAQARQQLAQQGIKEKEFTTPPITSADVALDNKTVVAATTAAVKLEVHVSLAPTLQHKIKPDDTLFIYARAMEGKPMPLAIVKKAASELPMTVTLDDSMAMMSSKKLSNFKEVAVLARVSTSGSAMVQSGDLQGQISPVVLDLQKKVKITINQIIP